jgi:two-component system sensor histidine kinase BaeS
MNFMKQSTCNLLSLVALPRIAPERRAATVWLAALVVAGFSTWILFGARPGINLCLSLLAITALAGILDGSIRPPGRTAAAATDLTALVLAAAVGVTADGHTIALVMLAVLWLCALSVQQRAGRPFLQLSIVRLVGAPFSSLAIVLTQAGGLAGDAVGAFRGGRYRAVLRGAAWALPTVVLFFFLLAEADPTFEAWRSGVLLALKDLSFLPRLVFWLLLAVLLLGAFALAAQLRPLDSWTPRERKPVASRTSTERCIVLGSVAILFALFLVLRLNALFGDPGSRVGSGMTYAQAVHRGFGELTGVVTLTALLILTLDASALREDREDRVRILSWVLLGECLLLLVSAWLRLLAYEEAYGYSMLRVYVHLYMLLVALGLLLLAREIIGRIAVRRVLRRSFTAALVGLGLVVYGNVSGWIVERNVERYQRGSALDLSYLVYGAGPDALPTIERLLPVLKAEDRVTVKCRLFARYASKRSVLRGDERWFEWNLRRRAARAALQRMSAGTDNCSTRSRGE